MLDCLSRWDLVLEIKYSCEVSLSQLSYKLTHHLRTVPQALNMACVNHAARHHAMVMLLLYSQMHTGN